MIARALVALSVLLAAAPAARGDERELAIHLDLAPAAAFTEDAQDAGATAVVPGGRVGGRASWGLTDTWALELGLAGFLAPGGEFADQMRNARTGTLVQDEQAFRATVGATLRLGVAWIPTLTAHVGYQRRTLADAVLTNGAGVAIDEPMPDRSIHDLVIVGGVGLDRRLGARWVAGLSVHVVYAIPVSGNTFASLEIPFTVAYYWYPWW